MNAAESTKNLLIYCTQFSKQYAYTNYQHIFIIAQFRITALDVSLLTRDSGTIKFKQHFTTKISTHCLHENIDILSQF